MSGHAEKIQEMVNNFTAIHGEEKAQAFIVALVAVQQLERQHALIFKQHVALGKNPADLQAATARNGEICRDLLHQLFQGWPKQVAKEAVTLAVQIDGITRKVDPCWS